jgi:cytochrome P450
LPQIAEDLSRTADAYSMSSGGLPDLADPGLYVTDHVEAVWAELRSRATPYWNESASTGGFWAVTRYDQAVSVYRNDRSFSNEGGVMLGVDRGSAATSAGAAAGRMLIATDPPRHSRLRQVVNSSFSARAVAVLTETIRTVVNELLDPLADGASFDFISEIGSRLPVAVICGMLDVPSADWPRMVELTSTAFGSVDPSDPQSVAAQRQAHAQIFMYYAELVAARRRNPGGDVISALVTGTVDGVPITDEEAILNCHGFITGGNETTRHASAWGVLALSENPAEWLRMRAGEVPIARAVEEILRWSSPAMHILRTATEQVDVGGAVVRPGDTVAIWNAAANRDAAAFDKADRFLVGRDPNRHLALGLGEHFCLGGPLARLEMRVLFEQITERFAELVVVGDPVRLRSNFLRGFTALPVAFRPSSS